MYRYRLQTRIYNMYNERCIIRRIEFYTGAVYKYYILSYINGDDCNSDYDNIRIKKNLKKNETKNV